MVEDAEDFDKQDNEIAAAIDGYVGSLLASMRSVRAAVEPCRIFRVEQNLQLANRAGDWQKMRSVERFL